MQSQHQKCLGTLEGIDSLFWACLCVPVPSCPIPMGLAYNGTGLAHRRPVSIPTCTTTSPIVSWSNHVPTPCVTLKLKWDWDWHTIGLGQHGTGTQRVDLSHCVPPVQSCTNPMCNPIPNPGNGTRRDWSVGLGHNRTGTKRAYLHF